MLWDLLREHGVLLLLLGGALAVVIHLARIGQAPLLVDALFVGLLLARPSLAATGLLIVQYGARRVPLVARGLGALWGREIPTPIAAVLLPGAAGTPPAMTGPTIALPAPVTPAPLPLRDWLTWANHTETAPHLAATGPTRSGKTTLILAVLWDRKGELVICTPKAVSTDPWGQFPAVRLYVTSQTISYAPIVDAIRQVYQEMLRRNAEDTIPHESPLTLVIDDYSTVVGEAPEVRPLILRLWTLGASARIRVIILDTEENVKAWGIEGRGEARGNLVFIRLGEARTATMYRWGQSPIPIDTSEVKRLADQASLAFRAWRGLSVRPSVAEEAADPVPAAQTDGRTEVRTSERQAKIALLAELRSRMSRAEARTYLATRGITFENSDWTEAGELVVPSAAS